MYPAPSPATSRHRTPLVASHRAAAGTPADRSARRQSHRPSEPAGDRLDFTGEPGERLRGALLSIQEVCPEFSPAQVLRQSPEAVLLAGSVGRRPVVAKCAVRDTARDRIRREIGAFRVFVRDRPPVRVPRLVGADSGSGTLVQEFLPGRPAALRRHLSGAPAAAELQGVFAGFGRLSGWCPPAGAFPDATGCSSLITRYQSLGLLTDRDVEDLHTLLRGLHRNGRQPRQFCHGAAFPSQVILTPAGPALVGWSAAGWYLPGRDLATLWAALGDAPEARRRISRTVHRAGPDHRDAFLVNLLLVLTREIRRCEESVRRAMREPGTTAARAASPPGGLARGERHRLLLRRLHDDCAVTRGAVRAAVGTR